MDRPVSADDILKALSKSQYKLLNLFELDGGEWQANLRLRKPGDKNNVHKDEWAHEWSKGKSALAALTAVWKKIESTEVVEEEYDI